MPICVAKPVVMEHFKRSTHFYPVIVMAAAKGHSYQNGMETMLGRG